MQASTHRHLVAHGDQLDSIHDGVEDWIAYFESRAGIAAEQDLWDSYDSRTKALLILAAEPIYKRFDTEDARHSHCTEFGAGERLYREHSCTASGNRKERRLR